MRIAVDATPLYGRFGGIENALWQTLLALHHSDCIHEFSVFVPGDAPNANFLTKPNWKWRRLPFTGKAKLRRIAWQQLELPRLLRGEHFDLLHATNYVMPLCSPIPTIVSIPDLIALDHPQFALRFNRWHYRAILPQTLKRASALLASTPDGARAIRRRVASARIFVAPLGVEPQFFEPFSEAEIVRVRQKYTLPARFLLFAGNFEPKKNLPNLLRAVELLGENAPELIFVGGIKPWPQLEKMALRVRFLGFVPREDLPILMNLCAAFCFPSRAEGFGLPVLEALTAGARVVASNAVPIPDLSNVAYRPNPRFPRSIANAITTALTDTEFDAQARRDFAAKFNWDTTARIILEAYEHVSKLQQSTKL